MLKQLEIQLKQKAKNFDFIKDLPISDYEIEAEITIYLKNKIVPICIDYNFRRECVSLEELFKTYNIFKRYSEGKIEEINCDFRVILQKFFHIKAIRRKFLFNDNEIIKKFKKYEKIFIAIENDLNKLQKVGWKKRFLVNKINKRNENEYCSYVLEFDKSVSKPLEYSKYIQGTFLMKELEKIYGTYFFRNSYEIWSEIVFEEKVSINDIY